MIQDKIHTKSSFRDFIPVLLPLLVYSIFTWLLKDWIVDDAGISFAYAKNLANGSGLVAQTDAVPVEGFSNFSWVLIHALTIFFGLFDPYFTPKILAFIFTGISLYLLQKIACSFSQNIYLRILIGCLAVCNAPYVIWANSGLENALYVFLLIWMIFVLSEQSASKYFLLKITFISCLIMISRPEGVLWILLPLSAIFYVKKNEKSTNIVLKYLGLVCAFIALLSLFRWFYFGDLLPNTFYAKMKNEDFSLAHFFEKIQYLSFALGGRWAIFIMIPMMLGFPFFVNSVKNKTLFLLYSSILISILIFMILPDDWMGELRFATVFAFLFYPFLFLFVSHHFNKTCSFIGLGLSSIFVILLLIHHIGRVHDFAKNPTVPLSEIKHKFEYFEKICTDNEIKNPSILIPDVGAGLLYSHIKIYDAAGLCDPFNAKNSNNVSALQDYVLEEIRPDIISLHGRWNLRFKLWENQRFFENYKILNQFQDSGLQKGEMIYFSSGDYVKYTN